MKKYMVAASIALCSLLNAAHLDNYPAISYWLTQKIVYYQEQNGVLSDENKAAIVEEAQAIVQDHVTLELLTQDDIDAVLQEVKEYLDNTQA